MPKKPNPTTSSHKSVKQQREQDRKRALRDLEGLKYEGGGWGGGWTQSALARSLFRTRAHGRQDFTPGLRRIVVALRVVAFLLLSAWFLWWIANR